MRFAPLLLALAALAHAEKKAIRPPAGPTAGPYSAGIVTDKFLYISGHVGPEPGGGFAPGDVKTQTRRCLELVGNVLKEAGLDFSHVVSTTLYLTDIRTLDAADAAYRAFFTGPLYPARIEIESPLLIPEALSEVSAIAVLGDPRASIYLDPDGWAKPKRPFSHAVLAAGTLFFSTLRPTDMATGALTGRTIAEQTAQLIRNQDAVLRAVKMRPADIAAARVFLADPRLATTYRAPAMSLGVAGPYEPGHLLQVQAVARKEASANTVYLPGMTGRGATIEEQTRSALAGIEAELKRRGMTLADTAEAVVWLREPRHAAAMNSVYREIVKPNPAARATVRLAPLGADQLIEITMTAHK